MEYIDENLSTEIIPVGETEVFRKLDEPQPQQNIKGPYLIKWNDKLCVYILRIKKSQPINIGACQPGNDKYWWMIVDDYKIAPFKSQNQFLAGITVGKQVKIQLAPAPAKRGPGTFVYDRFQKAITSIDLADYKFYKQGASLTLNNGIHPLFYKFDVVEITEEPSSSPTGAPTRACLDSAELETVIDEHATTGDDYLDEIKLCDDVTSFDGLFFGIDETLEYPIGGWDTSGITSMVETFMNNTKFNSDIGGWDMSSVTTLDNMFHGSTSFNQDLSSWDTTSVTNLYRTFVTAKSFNQDISAWDVSSVVNFKETFANSGFNQDLSDWDISKGKSFYAMFNWAEKFDRKLCWNIGKRISTFLIFENAKGGSIDLNCT